MKDLRKVLKNQAKNKIGSGSLDQKHRLLHHLTQLPSPIELQSFLPSLCILRSAMREKGHLVVANHPWMYQGW